MQKSVVVIQIKATEMNFLVVLVTMLENFSLWMNQEIVPTKKRGIEDRVLNRQFLPEFIMDATLDTVTSQSKVHKFLSSKIHVVLWVRTNKTLITLISLTTQGETENTVTEYND